MNDDSLTHLNVVRFFEPIPFLQLLDSDAVARGNFRERFSRFDVHHYRLIHCPRAVASLGIGDTDPRPVQGSPRIAPITLRDAALGPQPPVQTRERFRERNLQLDDVLAQPLDHRWPVLVVKAIERL